MCLVVVALGTSEDVPLAVAANRDEYFARPTAPAGWWRHEGVDVFGGRDLEKNGTWLGITRAGRIALVTNVRGGRGGDRSRGWLVRDALASAVMPPTFPSAGYPAYNLLVGDARAVFYVRDDGPAERVPAGFHGLSNHRLDTPWPKVESAVRAASRAPLDFEPLFRILADDTPAPDAALPSTGVPLEVERALSPPFVRMPAMGYGTRCSTVVLFHADGSIGFEERTFDRDGQRSHVVRDRLQVAS